MENIKSFIISLPQCQHKFNQSSESLEKLGIYPSKSDAVYGKNLDDNYIKSITYPSVQYTIKNGRSVDSDIFTHGAIGCYLSHVHLWKQLVVSEEEMFAIFEDDVTPVSYLDVSRVNSYIRYISEMDPNWDIIYLGWLKPLPGLKDSDIVINENTHKINDITFGTHSYIIRKKGARKLLERAFPIVDQVDSYLSYMICRGDITAYRPSTPFFVQSNQESSSIQESVLTNVKPIVNRFSNRTFLFVIIFMLMMIIALIVIVTNGKR